MGCGTGLSLRLLAAAAGADGHVVGVDAAPQMLAVAARRARGTPGRVTLLCADATSDRHPAWDAVEKLKPDAILFTYSLSLMKPWRRAWQLARSVAHPHARVAVVDMAVPEGRAAAFGPLARAACWLGLADIRAHPWRALHEEFHRISFATPSRPRGAQ